MLDSFQYMQARSIPGQQPFGASPQQALGRKLASGAQNFFPSKCAFGRIELPAACQLHGRDPMPCRSQDVSHLGFARGDWHQTIKLIFNVQ